MPYCENCGYEYVEGTRICPDCQAPLAEGDPVFCDGCEEPITGDAAFCPHCGVLLGWGAEQDEDIVCELHKKREAIGRCVVCGRPVCGECAIRKHGKIFCDNDEHVKMAFDWVSVITTGTQYEAEMIKANLEGAGIPAMVFSQNDRMYFTTLGDLAVNEVMVPKRLATEAKLYLEGMDAGGGNQDLN